MTKLSGGVKPPYMIKLAPMECASSCIMSYLASRGFNYQFFLLNYWNVNYVSNVLMSGKNIIRYNLNEMYGFQIFLDSGNEESIQNWLEQDFALLLRCKSSALPYFPREYLQFDDAQFEHFILLQRYDPEQEEYFIVDPICDFAGPLSRNLLLKMDREGIFSYYVFEHQDPAFQQPSPLELFRQAAESNFEMFTRAKRCQGDPAFTLFENDFLEAKNWPADKRNRWIDQNNITISSIVKTRTLIWDSLCDLALLTVEQKEKLQPLFTQLVRRWTSLNLRLLKFKLNPHDQERTASVQNHIQFLREHEYLLLKQLKEIGEAGAV